MARGRAHPRAGGENRAADVLDETTGGSSPRGRGKRDVREGAHRIVGLIPARAGKTSFAGPFNGEDGAHPRAGGEN